MSIALTRSGSLTGAVLARATASDTSVEMLVKRIAAGDKLAMQVLFARHRTPIYRWLLRFVGNETVAEDLLSDVFFDVWQQAGRFEGRSAVTTWLLSIARFKALSARRRRTHAELNEVIEATVADSADNAEVALEKKHEGEMLRVALTKLSPGREDGARLIRMECPRLPQLLPLRHRYLDAGERIASDVLLLQRPLEHRLGRIEPSSLDGRS